MSFFESMYIYERVLDVGKDGASYVISYSIQMYSELIIMLSTHSTPMVITYIKLVYGGTVKSSLVESPRIYLTHY